MSYSYTEPPPCNECGICCTTNLEFGRGGYVQLTEADYARLPEKYRLKVVLESDLNVDRLGIKGTPETGYRCTALKGIPNHKTSCDIYEQRPTVCRTFERGSPDCRKERANWLFNDRNRP